MKFMVAGVAVASAGALAVSPVAPTPTMPTVADVRQAAVELSAFQNPLEVLAATITKTVGLSGALGGNIVATSGQLLQGLGNPALHAEFAEFIRSTLANPLLIPGELLRAPFEYGGRIVTAGVDLIGAQLAALQLLPGVLQQSLTFLSQGKTLEAFGELNTWFLVDVLSDSRQTLLNALAIPGDFADAIGAHALARVFDSVLNRGTVGNLGRALLGPVVTAVIQVTEILDQTGAALMAGDLATVASNLLNAPAKIINAFVNGYVPDFTVDPQWPPQVFPGLLSDRGTFDFFFNQIPKAIAAALAPPAPAVNSLALTTEEPVTPSITSTNFNAPEGLTVTLVGTEDEVVTEVDAVPAPVTDVIVEAPVVEKPVVEESVVEAPVVEKPVVDETTGADDEAGESTTGDSEVAKTTPRKNRAALADDSREGGAGDSKPRTARGAASGGDTEGSSARGSNAGASNSGDSAGSSSARDNAGGGSSGDSE